MHTQTHTTHTPKEQSFADRILNRNISGSGLNVLEPYLLMISPICSILMFSPNHTLYFSLCLSLSSSILLPFPLRSETAPWAPCYINLQPHFPPKRSHRLEIGWDESLNTTPQPSTTTSQPPTRPLIPVTPPPPPPPPHSPSLSQENHWLCSRGGGFLLVGGGGGGVVCVWVSGNVCLCGRVGFCVFFVWWYRGGVGFVFI